MQPFSVRVTIEGKELVAAGLAPFQVDEVVPGNWIVAGRDGGNCLAFIIDGVRAIFDEKAPAVMLCRRINEMAPR